MSFDTHFVRKWALIIILILLSTLGPLPCFASPYGMREPSEVVVAPDVPEQVPPANQISGPQSVIVILVRFKDIANIETRDEVKDIVFRRLNDYISQVSYGAAWLTGNVTSQWYQLSRSRSYYGAGPASSERYMDLIIDSVRAADREVNFLNYEYVMIVYAGDDQDRSLNPNDITSGGAYGNGFPITTGEGTLGFGITWLAEKDPIGPYARYLAYNFRLPNLLNRAGNPLADNFVAEWDLMGHGFWANNGSTPAELTSWSRIRLGWMTETRLTEVNATESKTVDIEQLETSSDGVKAVRLPVSRYTYYLIEVRRKVSYDSYLPDEGVLILYVNEKLEDGRGIVRVVDSTPLTKTLNDAPLKVGGIFENKSAHIAVEVLSASNSSYKVLIDRTGQALGAYLTVYMPYEDIQVKIDGANLTTDVKNRIQRLVRTGSHVVEVPNTVYTSETSRAVFEGWMDGDTTNPRTLTVSENSTLAANYKMQHLLQVFSVYGSPAGSGWYDADAVAAFSIADVVDQGNGTRRVFVAWRGDSNVSSSTGQIQMDQPRIVSATWKTQYAVEFTSTGMKNETTMMLITNDRSHNYTVPFSSVEWFDEGSQMSFQVYPQETTAGMTTYKFEGWIDKDGIPVKSPLTVTQPNKMTAIYKSSQVFEPQSGRVLSVTADTFSKIYLKMTSTTSDFLFRHQRLLAIFTVVGYPFLVVVDFAHKLYLTFSFAPIFAAAGAVIAVGILLGLIYLFPISLVALGIYRWRRGRVPRMRMLLPVLALVVVGSVLIALPSLSVISGVEAISLAGFGILGLGIALLSALIPSIKIVGLMKPKRKVEHLDSVDTIEKPAIEGRTPTLNASSMGHSR